MLKEHLEERRVVKEAVVMRSRILLVYECRYYGKCVACY
jgi:hypothetical protein